MPNIVKKYFQALISELKRLEILALPETWADTNQLMNFLKNELKQQNEVLIAEDVWNVSASAEEKQIDEGTQFPLKQFLQAFLLDKEKNKFILPILVKQSHFVGIIITKPCVGAAALKCEISYFNPTGTSEAKSGEDREVLEQLRIALEELTEIIDKVKKSADIQDYQDHKVGQLTQVHIDQIKQPSFIVASYAREEIKILSDQQQINGCDCGYIVGQTLVELGRGQELSIKKPSDADYVAYAKPIAKVRAAFTTDINSVRYQLLSRLGTALASNEEFAKPIRNHINNIDLVFVAK